MKSPTLLGNGPEDVVESEAAEMPEKKKKRLGRSGRRRKAKMRAIVQEEEVLLSSQQEQPLAIEENSQKGDGGRPNDRGLTLPGVLLRRKELHWSPTEGDDANHVRRQLGYVPGNIVCVASRFRLPTSGLSNSSKEDDKAARLPPSVVKLYPLVARHAYAGGKADGRRFKSRRRGTLTQQLSTPEEDVPQQKQTQHQHANQLIIEPFPTMYWLTCPILRAHISRLENGQCPTCGASPDVSSPSPEQHCHHLCLANTKNTSDTSTYTVPSMERRLQQDDAALLSMKRAHSNYAKQRWNLLTHEDKQDVQTKGWSSSLADFDVEQGCDEQGEKSSPQTQHPSQENKHNKPRKNKKKQGRGIAGIVNPAKVKCLHAHAAHYLAGEEDNVVGKWVIDALERFAKAACQSHVETKNDEDSDGRGEKQGTTIQQE